MTNQIEKQADKTATVSSNLKIGVYTIYDCVLKQFNAPICVPISKLNDYFIMLINDCNSPYYNHEVDYILNKIGDFNQETGEVEQHFVERICTLDTFINNNKRNLQTIITTLNYLPSGFYKMPQEQKEVIQQQINDAVKSYVENYVVPDLDISSEKIKSLESIIDDYEQRLKIVEK